MAPKRARRGSRASRGDTESVPGSQVQEREEETDQIIQQENGQNGNSSNGATHNQEQDDDPNHVKIMLATDNHVGYMERDPVRGSDSINTFREILQMAKDHDVDFILLGGDLFHENRPSRTTMHQVMGALREFTLGDKPVSIELLSDPNDGKPEGYQFPAVNYEDPNLNVAIPVFSIHGNHDDPQGVGPEGALSAVDLLSISGLMNYFGKVELPSADDVAKKGSTQAPAKGGLSDVGIRIRPVLLQKGDTKIALYGMGNIKDERMNFELRSNRVRMYRPREDPDDWFNILAIHQNRAAHNPKATVPEGMFDDSVHLVVWGHEHEQLIKPQSVGGKRYLISQPGSSVATSLCPGEAAEKQVAIIHVKGRDFTMEPLTLKTVRPFVMDEVDLDEIVDQANLRIDDKQGVTKLLKRKVKDLIEQANQEWDSKHANIPIDEQPERMLPLVRLRVLYTRHEMGNLVRFGQESTEIVANPRDLLQFSKKKTENASRKNAGNTEDYLEPTDDMLPSEKLEKVSMSDLVRTYLATQSLHILNPTGLERAVMKFVEKDDKDAIGRFVEKELRSTNSNLVTGNPDEQALDAELDRIRGEKNRAADDERAANDQSDDDGGPRRGGTNESDNSSLGDFDIPDPAVAKKSTGRSTTTTRGGRGGGRKATAARSPQTQQIDEDDEPPTPAPKASSRAAALAGPPKKSTAKASKPASSRAAALASTSSGRRTSGTRAAARKATTRLAGDDVEEEDGDDDFEMVE
ncbi:DNA repair exonuclease [Meira miltonrushii]|uniref:Double-strand break repair protein n=1 Tax=Meira miltonrushii TaxID=1280837 RepID=A0A316VP29_9BASI|nr:DNA repair exonuclease [Meira miltonrushii]PWN37275.1 DNA repair exonuclease [Meira miltonrushii]